MSEPAIIGYGRANVSEYGIDEYDACLRQVFGEFPRADFITLDSSPRGQRFLAACVAWAISAGLLYNDRTDSDDQCEVASFRLTPAGERRWQGAKMPEVSAPATPLESEEDGR